MEQFCAFENMFSRKLLKTVSDSHWLQTLVLHTSCKHTTQPKTTRFLSLWQKHSKADARHRHHQKKKKKKKKLSSKTYPIYTCLRLYRGKMHRSMGKSQRLRVQNCARTWKWPTLQRRKKLQQLEKRLIVFSLRFICPLLHVGKIPYILMLLWV